MVFLRKDNPGPYGQGKYNSLTLVEESFNGRPACCMIVVTFSSPFAGAEAHSGAGTSRPGLFYRGGYADVIER